MIDRLGKGLLGALLGLLMVLGWIFVPAGYELRGLGALAVLLLVGLVFATVRDSLRRGIVVGLAMFFPMSLYGLDFSKSLAWASLAVVPAFFLLTSSLRSAGPMVPALLGMLAGAVISRLAILSRGMPQPSWDGDLLFLPTLCLVPLVAYSIRRGWLPARSYAIALGASGLLLAMFSLGLSAATGKLFQERLGLSNGINPNILCSFLDFSLPLTMMLVFDTRRRWLKVPLLAAMGLQLGAMVLAQTRGSVPGYVLTALTFLYLIRKQALLLVTTLMASVPFLVVVGAKVVQRIITPDTTDTASNLGRLGLLQIAFEVLQRNSFLFGVGMDNFKKIKEAFGFPRWFDQTMMMSSHNAHLEFWLGWGLPGLLGWLALLLGAIWQGVSVYRRERSPIALGVALGLAAFLFHGLVESLVAAPPFLVVLCLLIGMAYGMGGRVATSEGAGQALASTTRNS